MIHSVRVLDFRTSLPSGELFCRFDFSVVEGDLQTSFFYSCDLPIYESRNYSQLETINTNRKIEVFQNEKFSFTFHRAGPLLWYQSTNRPQLPVSIPGLLADRKTLIWTIFYSDYDLNSLCHDICSREFSKCLMICEPSDVLCIHGCMTVRSTCLESKLTDFNIISYESYDMIWFTTYISYILLYTRYHKLNLCVGQISKFL